MPQPVARLNDLERSESKNAAAEEAAGYRFGPFFLDVANQALCREGQPLALNPKYFEVLHHLVRRRGVLVSKKELFEAVWQASFVTDSALTQAIKDIRKCLGDSASSPRYIKTVPKRGYLFIEAKEGVGATAEAPVKPRPYKFLESFSEADAASFYGREDEIEEVCSRMLSHRTFLIYGLSGVGKSSFLAAGIVPRLKPGHAVCRIRSYHDPAAEIERLLAVTLGSEASDLVSLCRSYFEKNPLSRILFCLDQFEEWFLLLPEAVRQSFLASISVLMSQPFSSRLHFCFVLREDCLAEMSRLKSVFPTIFHHEYRLLMLDRERAARAVTAPAKAAGCVFEPGLLEQILDDLSEGGGVDLPALQIVCDQLYDKRNRKGGLTRAAYEELGQTSGILAAYLDRVLRRFDASGLKLARLCVSLLITSGGERRVLTSHALIAHLSQESGAEMVLIRQVIEELASARILRIRKQDGEGWIELVHDYLVATVSRWMSDAFKTRRRIHEIFERARHNYRDSDLLMSEESLLLTLSQGKVVEIDSLGADLLVRSCLHNHHQVPRWLAESCPNFLEHLGRAATSPETAIRSAAVTSSRWADRQSVTEMLVELALNDPEIAVRKVAGGMLADIYGDTVPQILRQGKAAGFAGTWRYLTSLAIIRDHDIATFSLFSQGPLIGLFITVCLAWVRLRRNSEALGRRTLGGTLGSALAGLISGLLLAGGVIAFNDALVGDRLALIVAFMSSGAVIGLLAGCGVCSFMCAVTFATIRHNRFWPLLGAAVGGFLTSVVFNQIANALAVTLLGIPAIETTRSVAVAAIAVAVTLGYLFGQSLGRGRMLPSMAGAALGGGIAGALIIFNGGLLLAGSLENLINQFTILTDTRPLFQLQEASDLFRTLLKTGWGFYEGASFGSGLVGGMLWLDKSSPPD